MSTVKTKINEAEVIAFLQKNFDSKITSIQLLKGGELSQACGFSSNGVDYVIRINKDDKTYKKDDYAFKHFASKDVPIPEILKMGKFNDDLYFAITKKAGGKTFDLWDEETSLKLAPQLLDILDKIHQVKIPQNQFGHWSESGTAPYIGWKKFILKTNEKIDDSIKSDPFVDDLYKQVRKLVPYLPEESYLIHGDYGFNNVVADGEKITAVLDWGESMYGDFVFDLAWFTFWPSNIDFETIIKRHYKDKGTIINNYNERLKCYQIDIGIGSLIFFKKSEQKDAYDWTKNRLQEILQD